MCSSSSELLRGAALSRQRWPVTSRFFAILRAIAVTSAEEIDLPQQQRWADADTEHQPGRVVREKQHPAEPMTVDRALYEMELVGHDFYLFNDSEAGRPSVVYRRKGFDYGVIRLG